MRYRYLDDFRRGISVFAILFYGIAVLGTPQCPPPCGKQILLLLTFQLTKVTGIDCNGVAGQFGVRGCICPFSASLRWGK